MLVVAAAKKVLSPTEGATFWQAASHWQSLQCRITALRYSHCSNVSSAVLTAKVPCCCSSLAMPN